MTKKGIFVISFFSIMSFDIETDAKIRFTTSTGFSLKNDLSKNRSNVYGLGLHLLYPVSPKDHLINTELGAASWYNYYNLRDDDMQTLRFGLAVRVYFNLFDKIEPYFTHDILSQITYISELKGKANTYSIILGLGIRLLQDNNILSALFTELTYSRFSLGYFEIEERDFSFSTINFGAEF